MTFNEREAIQIRMQQIFLERQSLQEEYKNLFSRLREIDERDFRLTFTKDETPLESIEKTDGWSERGAGDLNKSSLGWEDFDLGEQEQISTDEYDKRLDELQAFLEAETEKE